MCYAIYSLESTHPREFMKKMKNYGLIEDYYIFEILDHITSAPKLQYYDPSTQGWFWDWEELQKQIDINKQEKTEQQFFDNLNQ